MGSCALCVWSVDFDPCESKLLKQIMHHSNIHHPPIKLKVAIALALAMQISALQAANRSAESPTKTRLAAADVSTKSTIDQRHTQAIEAARAGETDEAIATLSALRELAPKDTKILSDYLVVLTWANKNGEAVSESKKINTAEIHEYALAAVAKAARKIGNFDDALTLYNHLIARNPSQIDYKIAHALVQIDHQQYAQAETEINALKENNLENIDLLNAQLYLGQQTNSQIKIIDASQRILALDPNNDAIAGTLASAASNLGATSKAKELSTQYHFDEAKAQPIQANYAASHVRWGEFEPVNPMKPYAETDAALNALDDACKCDWGSLDLNKPANRKMVFDRMLALHDRHRNAEVITHYQQLTAQKIEIPTYALSAAGDAYLALRDPEQALAIFNRVLAKEPNRRDTQLDQFYALTELERYDEASALAKTITEKEPSYLNRKNNPTVRQNDKKLQADTTATLGLAYGDDLAGSENKFVSLQKIGPNNAEIKNNLATIWRWRGWLDLAAKTYQKNLDEEKNDLQAKYGLANTHLDGRDWVLAEQEIKDLNSYISPEDPSLKALNRRWELHNKRQFTADFSTSKSSGGAVGSKTNNVNAWLYSAPFNDNYRAFINTGYSRDTFTEGNGTVVTPNIGLEYRSHEWRISTQLGAATKDGSGAATATSAEYRANDYWLFNAGLELNSQQAPVRGQRVGIDGNAASLGASYRWSELMQATAGASYMHLSDGNTRQGLSLALDRRIYTTPHYKANLNLNAATSRNSLDNAVYFNPKSDISIGATLRQDWITWRRYDRSFTQRLGLSVGNYQQQNFGSKGTWSISYSHDWEFDGIFELEYGISHSSQPYDGITESSNSLFGRINLLF